VWNCIFNTVEGFDIEMASYRLKGALFSSSAALLLIFNPISGVSILKLLVSQGVINAQEKGFFSQQNASSVGFEGLGETWFHCSIKFLNVQRK
jgi:hypothetical protein